MIWSITTVQGLSKLSRFVFRINDCKASRVSIFDVKKCSGGGQLQWSRRQWFFLNLYDDLGECSSGRESVRWSLDFGGFSIKDLLLGNRFF